MENFTHTLVGAAIAGAAVGDAERAGTRRSMLTAGVLAANAPDLDLLYTWITPAPLGYLLHHRGHTHTVAGVIALSAALALIWHAFPSVRGWSGAIRARLAIVISTGVLSHLLLDAGNSYGVHPFSPIDMRWYYGDSLFIFEPALWLLFGGTLAMNARRRAARGALLAAIAGLTIATGAIGLVPWAAVAVLAAAAGALAWTGRHLRVQVRAAAAIAGAIVFGVAMFGLSRVARAQTVGQLPSPPGSALLDVVLMPNPAFPLCWAVIAVERDDAHGLLRLRRGSISLLPRQWPAARCPLQQIAAPVNHSAGASLTLPEEVTVSLQRLREGAAADCRLRAWLRFVRAPVVTATRAYDLRFERPGGGNFTAMTIDAATAEAPCPRLVPQWTMPRADALSPR